MGSAMKLLLQVTLLAVASASAPALPGARAGSSGNCPDKWVDASFVDMGCLYFNSTAGLAWDAANVMCQMGSNSTLIAIENEMQLAFLQMELNVIADHDGRTHNWWTAGTDVGINGRWIWATTLNPIQEYIWEPSKPNIGRDDWNYLYLYATSDYLGVNAPATDPLYP